MAENNLDSLVSNVAPAAPVHIHQSIERPVAAAPAAAEFDSAAFAADLKALNDDLEKMSWNFNYKRSQRERFAYFQKV